MRETRYMSIDPELQAMLDDLRAGYGDATDREAPKAPAKSLRARDWELRTGYVRERTGA
jgi:hypothetical protein